MTHFDAIGAGFTYCTCDNCDRTYPSSYQNCTYCAGRLRLIVHGKRSSDVRPSFPIEIVWSLERLAEVLYLYLSIVDECFGGVAA